MKDFLAAVLTMAICWAIWMFGVVLACLPYIIVGTIFILVFKHC